MKKISILSSILLLLVGCAAELENDNPIVDSESMTVSFEPVTRAQFNAGQRLVWNEGDLVSVFHKQDKAEKWTYMGSESAYTGTIKRSEVSFGNDISKSIVVYPYSEDYTINTSSNKVSGVFPSVQSYRQNSFGEGGSVMIAASEGNNFTMKSVVGWLKLQLTGDKTVGKIILNGNDTYSDVLAGAIDINYETLAMNFVGERNFDGITLDCGSGVALSSTPTDFYIALPPHKFASGLAVAVKDPAGKFLMTTSTAAVEITRGAINNQLAAMDINESNVTPKINSIFNMADASAPGAIYLSVGWDAQFNGVITKVAYEIWTADGSSQVDADVLDLYDAWGSVVSYDKASWAGKYLGNGFTPMGVYKVKVTPYIDDIVGETLVQDVTATGMPSITSVANTAIQTADSEGNINLYVTWPAGFNGKITDVYYELKNDTDYTVVSFGNMAKVGYIGQDNAQVWISGLTPGATYWAGVQPYIGEITTGEVKWFSDTPLYATTRLIPEISSIENTAAATEDGVINLVARWDSKFNDKITSATYTLQKDGVWSDITGDMTVHSGYAEARITELDAGATYYAKVTPKIGSTAGVQGFFTNVPLTAGKAPAPPTPKLTKLVAYIANWNSPSEVVVEAWWDTSVCTPTSVTINNGSNLGVSKNDAGGYASASFTATNGKYYSCTVTAANGSSSVTSQIGFSYTYGNFSWGLDYWITGDDGVDYNPRSQSGPKAYEKWF